MSETIGAVISGKNPRKFGLLTAPKSNELEQPAWLPPELRGVIVEMNLPHEQAAAKYGTHKLRIIKSTSVWGEHVEPGDEVEVAGNVAVLLIHQRQAESLDDRRTRELELMREARRLKLRISDADNPAFDPPPTPLTPRRRFVQDWKNQPEGN